MTRRSASRPSWGSMAVVAPGSLAFLAGAVMWVSAHDPNASDVPSSAVGPTSAALTPAALTPAGSTSEASTSASSRTTSPGDDNPIGLDSATSLRLARLQVLLGQAEARLVLLDSSAVPTQAPSPALVVPPPAPAAQPPLAPAPAPVAHATTGASGA